MKNTTNHKITPKLAHESERIVDVLVSGYRTSYCSPRLNYNNVIEQLVRDAQSELRSYDMHFVPTTLHLCLFQSLIDGEASVGWLTTEDIMYTKNWVEALGEIDVATFAGIVDGEDGYVYTVDAEEVRSLILSEVVHA